MEIQCWKSIKPTIRTSQRTFVHSFCNSTNKILFSYNRETFFAIGMIFSLSFSVATIPPICVKFVYRFSFFTSVAFFTCHILILPSRIDSNYRVTTFCVELCFLTCRVTESTRGLFIQNNLTDLLASMMLFVCRQSLYELVLVLQNLESLVSVFLIRQFSYQFSH